MFIFHICPNKTGIMNGRDMVEWSLCRVGLLFTEVFSCGFMCLHCPWVGLIWVFFGRLCCTEGLRGTAKGSSVLHRGNGRSPWKVWMEWHEKSEKNEGGVVRLERRGPSRGAQCCRVVKLLQRSDSEGQAILRVSRYFHDFLHDLNKCLVKSWFKFISKQIWVAKKNHAIKRHVFVITLFVCRSKLISTTLLIISL